MGKVESEYEYEYEYPKTVGSTLRVKVQVNGQSPS
jgi:predicted Mrr-cat superfamily restriction endonuclease